MAFGISRIGIGIPSSRRGGLGIPFKTDALFHLDGEIITIGSDQFFKDQVGSRNFLITGYDFYEDWIFGFPYKTLATISAPVGDAVLIAADVNNFLYAAGGTPNQIPIVALFQDIDYAHKLFTRHATQKTDVITGYETYEPRVLDIVLYANVKADGDLTKCNSYFGVPTENANAIWVTKTGHDVTGNGTKALPFLTIQKGVDTAGANGTVYLGTGVYAEATRVSVSKPLTMQGLSNVRTSSTNTGNQFIINHATVNSTHNFNRIIFDGTTVANNNITDNAGLSGMTYNFNSCGFFNYSRGGVTITAASSTTIVRNSIHSSARVIASAFGTTIKSSAAANIILMYGNYIRDNSHVGVYGNCPTFHYNKIIYNGSNNFLYSFYSTGISVDYRYNYFKSTNAASTSEKAAVYVLGATSVLIAYNKILIDNIYGYLAINVFGSAGETITEGCHIHNNYIIDYAHATHVLSVGTEDPATGDNKITGIIIEKNTVLCHRYFAPNEQIITHTIYVGFQPNAIVRYNYVNGGGINYIIKGSVATANTTGYVAYNVSVNAHAQDFFIKGISGYMIYGNTAYKNNGVLLANIARCIYLTSNLGGDESNNTLIRNNILIDESNGSSILIDILTATGVVSNNNVMYNAVGFYGNTSASTNRSFAQWQALGFDANSTDSNIPFNDVATFKMWPVTPVVGADLGAAFDDGLDITTNWGTTLLSPTIVTRQQSSNWQTGAYVQ
jgi:hypothetical protein